MKKCFPVLFLLLSGIIGLQAVQLENTFLKPDSMKGWTSDPKNAAITPEGLRIRTDGTVIVRRNFPTDMLRSMRVCLEVEVRGELETPPRNDHGGRFALIYRVKNGKTFYPAAKFPHGKFDWTCLKFSVDLPADTEWVRLDLGSHNGKGEFSYRNLKISAEDLLLDLRPFMNMGFRDAAAGDGKGGWSDQGPENDASGFRFDRKTFAGIPFSCVNPASNNGKSTVLFAGSRFPNGVREFSLDVPASGAQGKYLYLLHTLTWGGKTPDPVGKVHVTGEKGKTVSFDIQNQRELGDWWSPRRLPNAYPAAVWRTGTNGRVGIYASAFSLPKDFGAVRKIRFQSANSHSNWHLIAGTLSSKHDPFPQDQKVIIREGAEWRPMPKQEKPGIVKGSALDLTAIIPWKRVDETGRVIIRKDGLLEFEKEPGKIVRFLAAPIMRSPFTAAWGDPAQFHSKQDIEEFCIQLRRAGYNMIRLHGNDTNLVTFTRPAKDYAFSEKYLDQVDYLLFCMKKYGIYLNVDAMMSSIGYSAGAPWEKRKDHANYKFDIHFSPEVRENWEKGFMKFLKHENPYTKTRLIDDPVLAMTVCYNEQEAVFFTGRPFRFELAKPFWRDFLKKRYQNFDALRKAWGKNTPPGATSFETLPAFSASDMLDYRSEKGRDFSRFSAEKERETMDWYISTLRKNQFPAMISSVNMGLDFRYILLRSKFDLVTINGYHAHPMGDHLMDIQCSINPTGSIAVQGRIIRGFSSIRLYGKPIVNTEHGHGFWNPRRYEQGFIVGGYAALQDFSGLSAFGSPVAIKKSDAPIRAFQISKDPVLKGSEFFTALAFLRGDVTPSAAMIRLGVDEKMISAAQVDSDGINSEQTKLALVTKIAADPGDGKKILPNELRIPALGGSRIFRSRSGLFQNAMDSDPALFHADSVIAELKKKKLLPESNRTRVGKGIFESSTGELFMDSSRNFMSVDTPRLQGICASAGTRHAFKDFSIEKMSVNGNIVLAAIDGQEPISRAKRLVLLCVTDALNTDMEFENPERTVRLKLGRAPALLRTGKFRVTLKHLSASKLRFFALRFDGTRAEELPVKRSGNTLSAEIDTGKLKEGVSFYFELAEQ